MKLALRCNVASEKKPPESGGTLYRSAPMRRYRARASSLPRLARTLCAVCGPLQALRCVLRGWHAPPAWLSLEASTARMHRNRRRFRFAATVAHRAITAQPGKVVTDASPRVVTGGVLPGRRAAWRLNPGGKRYFSA